jgi:hypothetical protein
MSSINFDVSLNPLNTWNCFSYGTQVWLLFSLSTELYAAHLLLLLDMSTTHSRENEIGRIDDTDTHTSVWRWYNQKEKKINNKGRSITEIHVKSFGTSRCCVYKRRFFWWVGSPSQELITSQWIHWSPATFYKTKTATRRRHKRKKDFPKSIRPRWWESSQKKKRENNNESEWENCLQPRDFSRKKVGILIFFVISSSLRASVCVCVLYTNIDPHTRPTLFCAPGFPCALLAV